MKIIYSLVIILFFSCNLTKKVIQTKETEKVENKDVQVVDKEEISREIAESIQIKVQKSNHHNEDINALVDSKVRNILSKLNYQKTSGNNHVNLSYNEFKDLLELKLHIAESKSTKKSEIKTESITNIEKDDTFKKISKLPFVFWIVIAIIFLIIVRKFIKDFFPHITFFKM